VKEKLNGGITFETGETEALPPAGPKSGECVGGITAGDEFPPMFDFSTNNDQIREEFKVKKLSNGWRQSTAADGD
jgi:hypothetical protein